MNEKKEVSDGSQNTSNGTFPTDSIPQNTLINQDIVQNDDTQSVGQKKSKFEKKKRHCLNIASKVNSCAIKIYDEQMPNGWDYVCENIRNSDKSYVQVMGIRHDRDLVTDGIWKQAIAKPHVHIIIRFCKRETRVRVGQILHSLGIVFRKDIDDDLWKNHGVETIGNFAGYATYLTHETEDAVRDGKELYDISELVSNMTKDEMLRIRDGYTRVSDEVHKISTAELQELDKCAFDLGYNMKNFNLWYNSQPFIVRSNAKMKTIRESYDRGVAVKIEENAEIIRLCIFIKGDPNTGKTYGAKRALDGKQILCISGGGTGKFDKLRADHDAIIIDDDVCGNLLNMTDNYICHAYKRNSNNPAWSGEYFIVTSNLSFKVWLEQCGIKTDGKHYDAMRSRFFICEVVESNGVNHLACREASTRGTPEVQMKRADKFMAFKKTFDAVISTYQPSINYVDFSSIIEKEK